MPTCVECGRDTGFFGKVGDRCSVCKHAEAESQRAERELDLAASQSSAAAMALGGDEIAKIVLTTESPPNLEIIERIEIVTAECAFGMNVFKDIFAGVRDIVGGRSKAVQNTMRDARRTVLAELKREAHAVGANAVVGVDLDYVELSSPGSMVMLVASGTAVRAKL